jgi:hypothetical protein
MPEIAQTGRRIKDFPGLILKTDLHDLQEGSTNLQVNCTSGEQGTLKSRDGYVLLTFEGE